ncbi:sigma-70 family RNA polymerase sigma factor [Sporosarcina highlanderae]|uniref:Sigma-70 family RNA polymerase sigma factor n=1 Tax=Sporosarcina highlanderae TaxID=3035916 RepID=A0ABT8JWI8_9BACL|nr:sigma-70 family RNA polymerase sigma factor [Sporosarcina highlanderae]MDN4608926.1 sigma-70 family RNA polymerase sigma factor [Sporosarcina highlanderae]
MKINEQNFLALLQAGKEEALDYVIDHYLPLIRGVVVKTLGPLNKNDLSKECCNEILLSIWKNAKKFTGGPTDFQKWVCVIAKYKAVDYIRTEMRKKENISLNLDFTADELTYKKNTLLEEHENIYSIISKLKPVDQKIFIMKYLLDFDTVEIARQLQMTKSAIDNRLYYGKKKLRKSLGGIQIEEII